MVLILLKSFQDLDTFKVFSGLEVILTSYLTEDVSLRRRRVILKSLRTG